jgi:fatty-acyl-CoA synthase
MPTVAQTLCTAFVEAPDRPALHLQIARQPDQTLTYRALMQGAAGYAHALVRADIQPGEVVVLILQHSEALVYAFYGTLLHGAIPSIMPFLTEKLAPEKYWAELAALIATTQPAAILTYPEFESEVQGAIAAADQGKGGSVRAVLNTAGIVPEPEPTLETLAGLGRSPADIALLQHSSGTTGLQKGVALSHEALFNQLRVYREAIQLTQDDVIVSWLPLYHDMGLIAGFVMPVLERVPLVLMSPFDWVRAPYKLMQAVSQYKGTLSWLPNFAFNFCAQKTRDRDLEGVDLSSWRAVINCSEPVHAQSHEVFQERFAKYGLRPEALATCYAMAENVFAVSQSAIGQKVTVDEVDGRALLTERLAKPVPLHGLKMLSCGKPLPNVKVRVLDEARQDLPERHLGDIALQSDCLLTGYYHREDATAQAFHEGWYLTGDLGYMANGELYITGRKKELIIVGGKNVYPQDLERLASGVEGVHPGRVVAFGIDDETAGTEEVVVVAEVETADPDERQRIGDAIRQRVTQGSDVALRRVRVVDPRWMIKTSSGKPARLACREKYLSEPDAF